MSAIVSARAEDLERLFLCYETIERVRGGASGVDTYDDLRQLIRAAIIGHRFFAKSLANPFGIWRGRIGGKDKFQNLSELISRRPEDIDHFGRCHSPGHSIFYGSMNIMTVLAELGPALDERVVLIRARVKKSARVTISGIGELDRARRNPNIDLKKEFGPNVDFVHQILLKPQAPCNMHALLVDAFLAEEFRKSGGRRNDYIVTSLISKLLFEAQSLEAGKRTPKVDGFTYPSVAHLSGHNCAISHESFLKLFYVDLAFELEVRQNFGYGLYTYELGPKAEKFGDDGSIIWTDDNVSSDDLRG